MDDLGKQLGTSSMITSSFVYHFIAIGVFKLELQSGNAEIRENCFDLCDIYTKNPRPVLLYDFKTANICGIEPNIVATVFAHVVAYSFMPLTGILPTTHEHKDTFA